MPSSSGSRRIRIGGGLKTAQPISKTQKSFLGIDGFGNGIGKKFMNKGRRPKKEYQRKQSVSLTGRQWSSILSAINIKILDLNGEWEDQARELLEIESKIFNKVVLPPSKN